MSSPNTKKSVCGRRGIYKKQPFSKRLPIKISITWVSGSKGCGESWPGHSTLRQGSEGAGMELNPAATCSTVTAGA